MTETTRNEKAPLTTAERLIVRLFCGHCGDISDKTLAQLLTSTHPIACDVCDSHIDLESPDNKSLVDEAFQALERSIARSS
jgi:hypothetical protein